MEQAGGVAVALPRELQFLVEPSSFWHIKRVEIMDIETDPVGSKAMALPVLDCITQLTINVLYWCEIVYN